MSDDSGWEADRAAEFQARREALAQRKRIRRRRIALAGGFAVVVLGGAGAAVAALTGGRHVVITVTRTAPTSTLAQSTPTGAGTGSPTQTGTGTTAGSTTVTSTTKTGTSAAPEAPVMKAGSSAAFKSFAAGQPGAVSVALAPLGGNDVTTLGSDAVAHAWSTSKVPVLVSLIDARHGAGQLTASERAEAQKAITQSDNQSILELFGDLKKLEGGLDGASGFITQQLRSAGDRSTSIATAPPPAGAATTFGQTEWSPSNSVRFFRALGQGCLMNKPDSLYVLGLMEHISPSESWGLGSAGFSKVAFKGGWGPEGGAYLVRQSGVIDPGSRSGVAVSIVAHPPAGGNSFNVGTQMVTATAKWVSQHVQLVNRNGGYCG